MSTPAGTGAATPARSTTVRPRTLTRTGRARLALAFGALLALGLTAIVALPSPATDAVFVAGRPSPADIVAPRSIEYVGSLGTEARRATAEQAVAPVYSDRDRSVADTQRRRVDDVFAYLALVRASDQSSGAEKRDDLVAPSELAGLTSHQLDLVLALD